MISVKKNIPVLIATSASGVPMIVAAFVWEGGEVAGASSLWRSRSRFSKPSMPVANGLGVLESRTVPCRRVGRTRLDGSGARYVL